MLVRVVLLLLVLLALLRLLRFWPRLPSILSTAGQKCVREAKRH